MDLSRYFDVELHQVVKGNAVIGAVIQLKEGLSSGQFIIPKGSFLEGNSPYFREI